jgi:hypothetical protein
MVASFYSPDVTIFSLPADATRTAIEGEDDDEGGFGKVRLGERERARSSGGAAVALVGHGDKQTVAKEFLAPHAAFLRQSVSLVTSKWKVATFKREKRGNFELEGHLAMARTTAIIFVSIKLFYTI